MSSIIPTLDGGYIAAGFTESNDHDIKLYHGGDNDIWIIKVKKNGDIDWQRTYGGSGDDIANCIKQTPDSGYVIIGSTDSKDGDINNNHRVFDLWVLRLNKDGSIKWENTYGGQSDDVGQSIALTTDNGFIAVGFTYSADDDVTNNHGGRDGWLVKIDSAGKMQWQKTYGGGDRDHFFCIDNTLDSGYIISGFTLSTDGDLAGIHSPNDDGWIIKLKKDSIIEWQHVYRNGSNCILSTPDSGYIAVGSGSNATSVFPSILKLDNKGAEAWRMNYIGPSPFPLTSSATSVCIAKDGGYLVSGITDSIGGNVSEFYGGSDIWLLKLDTGGYLQWQKTYGGSSFDGNGEYPAGGYYGSVGHSSIATTADGGCIFTGYTFSADHDVKTNYGGGDAWIVKLKPDTSISTSMIETKIAETLFSIHPNPTNSRLYLTQHPPPPFKGGITQARASIIDLNGRTLLNKEITTGEVSFDVSVLPSGIYLFRYQDAERVWNGKFVKE